MANGAIGGKRSGDGADRVYDGLRRIIVEQTLETGARLPEDAVAERFGVSRTLVRAAFSRLIMDGLVERENNKVARVASPTREEADDLFFARRHIEAAVVDRLFGSVTKKDADRLRAHVRLQRSPGLERSAAVRLSGEFHVLLAEISSNRLLHRYVTEVVGRSSVALTAQSTLHSLYCSAAEHDEIIEAICGSDLTAAQDCMCRHLQGLAERAQRIPGRVKEFVDLAEKLFE